MDSNYLPKRIEFRKFRGYDRSLGACITRENNNGVKDYYLYLNLFWFNFTLVFIRLKGKSSKAFCECGHETLQDPKSKVYDGGSFTNIICSECGIQTTWNLDAPVPLFIKSLKNK